ncbi:hypothetical protein [Bradyrhizobium sp. SZCCHNS1054]|uniref:hypothetical protein n=1 Tax=Bradyrhizobium sp. SZCCHNS1054 TaxID=3057301 RepID=UPI002915DB05|nr:hypothetical protein [Bradyrhizobium sp. SZCCHNS1054]
MSDVDDRLTLEVLKRLQQRLHRAENKIDDYEIELNLFREQQISVLRDLHQIYELLGQHHESLIHARGPSKPTLVSRDEFR